MGKSTSFATQPSVLANQGDRCIVSNRHRRLLIRVSWRQRASVLPTTSASSAAPLSSVVSSPVLAPTIVPSSQPAPHHSQHQKSAFSDPPVSAPSNSKGPQVLGKSSPRQQQQPKTAQSSSKSRKPATQKATSPVSKKDGGLNKRRSRTGSVGKEVGVVAESRHGGENVKNTASVLPTLAAAAPPPPPPLYHPAYECHEPPADYHRYFQGKKSKETIAESSRNIVVAAPPIDLRQYNQRPHHQVATDDTRLSPAKTSQKLDCTDPNLRALIHSVSCSSPPTRGTTAIGVSTAAATSPRRIPCISSTQSHASSSVLMLVDSCLHALDGHSGAHIDHVDLGRSTGSHNALIHRPAMMSDHFAKLAKAPVDAGRLGEGSFVGVNKRTSTSSHSNSSPIGLLPPSTAATSASRRPTSKPSQSVQISSSSGRKRGALPSIPTTKNKDNVHNHDSADTPSSTETIRRRGSVPSSQTGVTTQLLPSSQQQPEWILGDVILADLHLVATMGAGACVYSLTAFDQNKFINRDLVEIKIEVLDAVTDAVIATLPIVPYMEGPTSINVLPCGDIESYLPPSNWGDAEDNESLIVYPKSASLTPRMVPSASKQPTGRGGNIISNNATITVKTPSSTTSGDPDIEAVSMSSPTTTHPSMMKGSSTGSRVGLLCRSMVAFELCRQKPSSTATARIGGKHTTFTSNMSDAGGDGPLSMTTTSLASFSGSKPQGWVLRRVCEGYSIRNPTLVHAVVEGRYVARTRALEQQSATGTFMGFQGSNGGVSKPLTKRQSSRRLLTSSRAVSVIPPGELIGMSSTSTPPTALSLKGGGVGGVGGAAQLALADADVTPPYNELMLSPDNLNINPAVRRTSSLFSESRSGGGSSDFDTLSEEEDDNHANNDCSASAGVGGGGAAPTAMIRDGLRSYSKGRTLRTGGDRARYGAFHNTLRTETRRAAAKLHIISPKDNHNKHDNKHDHDLSVSTDDDEEHGLDALPPIHRNHYRYVTTKTSEGSLLPHPPSQRDDSGGGALVTAAPPSTSAYRMTSPPPPPTVVSSGGAVREPLLVTAVRAALPNFDSTSTIRYGSNCYNSGAEEGTLIAHFEEHRRQYIRGGSSTIAPKNNTSPATAATVSPRKRLGAPPVSKGVDLMPESWLKAIEEEKMRKRGKAAAVLSVNMQNLERKLSIMAGNEEDVEGTGGESPHTITTPTLPTPHKQPSTLLGNRGMDMAAASYPKPSLPPEMEELRQLQQQANNNNGTILTQTSGSGGSLKQSGVAGGKDVNRIATDTRASPTISPRRDVLDGGVQGLLVATQPRPRQPAAGFPAGLLRRQ